jgi:hypothetical protein|tara:strand:- start:86 stop:274 length:189 start_codon:yes stop_codon:yes gene_type:complete
MKKLIILLLLTSCSFNNTGNFWTENLNSNDGKLDYNEDYTIEEYKKILKKYNAKAKYPTLNK